jgi:transcription antitermination factor NusG
MSLHWYALRSKPHKEEALWHQVGILRYETFYPRLKVKPVNPRSRRIRPYFPGYFFVRADLDDIGLSKFRWMPYSLGLVSFGGEPAYVPDDLIHALRKRVNVINEAGGELADDLQRGEKVLIHSGLFEGYEAIFDSRISGSERVMVLLELLSGKSIRLELNRSEIEQEIR